MANRDHLMAVATQISQYMNAFRLAFKTYNTAQFDEMIAAVAGTGQKITAEKTAPEFETVLLHRGFTIFPPIGDTKDGYVRVIRASSLTSNLLNAFLYPGANGDAELARLLRTLRARRRDDDEEPEAE